jgi:peptidylprolyl isomerase
MKHSLLPILLVGAAGATFAQTTPKPTTVPKAATAAKATVSASGLALPPGVPRVHGIVKTAFSLRYEDYKIGTGADAEPNEMYKVLYTGYLAADGHKFDSSEDHRLPLKDKDGKPVIGDDGKPKLDVAQPIAFPQGFGRLIPGFDQGFSGMKVGGKRRLFIPWQLAYGAHGHPGPDPAHPGIPPRADLIFDIELVDVSDLQMPQNRPGVGSMPGGAPRPGMSLPQGHVPVNPATPSSPANSVQPATPSAPKDAAQPATAPAPAATPQPDQKPATTQPNH